MADPQIDIKIGIDARQAQATLSQFETSMKQMGGTTTAIAPQMQQQFGSVNSTLVGLNYTIRDMPFGFIGIQNNLPMLFDGFKKLKEETGGASSAFKMLLSGLTGPAGIGIAFSAITSLITYFSMQPVVKEAKQAKDELAGVASELIKIKQGITGTFGMSASQMRTALPLLKEDAKNIGNFYENLQKTTKDEYASYQDILNSIPKGQFRDDVSNNIRALQKYGITLEQAFDEKYITDFANSLSAQAKVIEQDLNKIQQKTLIANSLAKQGLSSYDTKEATVTGKDPRKERAKKIDNVYEEMLKDLQVKTKKAETETLQDKLDLLDLEHEKRLLKYKELNKEKKLTDKELVDLQIKDMEYLQALSLDLVQDAKNKSLKIQVAYDEKLAQMQKAMWDENQKIAEKIAEDNMKRKEDQHQKDMQQAKELQDGIIGLGNNLRQAFNIGADTAFSKFLALLDMTNQILGNLDKIGGSKNSSGDLFSKGFDFIGGLFSSSGMPSPSGAMGASSNIVVNTYVDGAIIQKKVIEGYAMAQNVNQRARRV